MNKPLVSVVMTTFKRKPRMVKRAINSVLNQTHRNLEIIIVDDSPVDYKERDNVASMINSIDDYRIEYIQHEENRGACVARNTGIKRSTGEYIIYFDDDDELLPNKIEYSLNKFYSKEIGLVYSQNFLIDQNGKKRHMKNRAYSGYVFKQLIKDNFVVAFPLIRKECFIECGLFDPQMQSMQDYEMWLRIAQKYEFECVEEPLSIVYHHKGERISTNAKKKIQGAEEIYKRYKKYLDTNKSAKNIRLLKLAINYVDNGQIEKAKSLWIKAFMTAPYKFKVNLRYLRILYKNFKKQNLKYS